jgi:hypothetical protein
MSDLSPAAQAVMDATDYPEDWATRIRVAAALRTAADQVMPRDPIAHMYFHTATIKHIYLNLLAIATELEGFTE